QGAAEVGFGDADTRGPPWQVPYRIDGRLGNADLAIFEQNSAVGAKAPLGDKQAKLRRGEARRGNCNRRTYVEAVADVLGEDFAGEVAPGVERHDLGRIDPLRTLLDLR